MELQRLVAMHGYGVRVQHIGQMPLPFTVVESRFGIYYFICYDDGRTGYIDKRLMAGDYEICNGAACTEGARMACIQPVVGSTPIGSTVTEEEKCGQNSSGSQPSRRRTVGSLLSSSFRLLFGWLGV